MQRCFHGGAFWHEIGPSFDDLSRSDLVVNADVLDAWFPPAPAVIEALEGRLPWLSRTSPPTHAEGLVEAISTSWRLPQESLLAGAGSSSLIFSAFREWLQPSSRVLLIEPSYGEYQHLCDLIGCKVDRVTLRFENGFRFDLAEWEERLAKERYDLAVLVNPNNPTGGFVSVEQLTPIFTATRTRVLIDEAYIDYTGQESCETLASDSDNVFVVKSLSKGLALSGMRAAYLVGSPEEIAKLARWSPPWAVSLPAQIAAVAALAEPGYYAERYRENMEFRQRLMKRLCLFGGAVIDSPANWLLWRLPDTAPSASEVVARARQFGVHLRDAGATAPSLGDRFVRIAVKEPAAQDRILAALQEILF